MKNAIYLVIVLFFCACGKGFDSEKIKGTAVTVIEENGIPTNSIEDFVDIGIPVEGVFVSRTRTLHGEPSFDCIICGETTMEIETVQTDFDGKYELQLNEEDNHTFEVFLLETGFNSFMKPSRSNSDFLLTNKVPTQFVFKSNDINRPIDSDSLYCKIEHPISGFNKMFSPSNLMDEYIDGQIDVKVAENFNLEFFYKYGWKNEWKSFKFYLDENSGNSFEVFID